MINKNLNFEELHKQYSLKRRIYIKNVLEESYAHSLLEKLQDLQNNNLWYKADYGTPVRGGSEDVSNKMKRLESEFAYSYEKYPLHNQGHASITSHDSARPIPNNVSIQELATIERELKYKSVLGEFVSYFNSGDGKRILEGITNHSFSDNGLTCYASRYSANDFNNVHTDGMPTRLVTMVLYLSKNWVANWGGITCVLDDDAEDILEAFSPKFNSAIIFDVPLFHMVTPISRNCKEHRYTLTNWYHKYE